MSVAAAAKTPVISMDPAHKKMSDAIRALSMDAVEKAKSGHPGMPMGMADVATVLWTKFLRFDPANPYWPDRDRFILSAGHGSMLLYALAYLTGFKKMTIEEIKNFRQLGSHTAGHPELDPEIAAEMTTGPLGQGISHAVGFALAERILNTRFGNELVDHHTYVIASDGDMMEGISHEAASLAGHLKLGRLIVYYDDNQISIDGPTTLSFSEDVQARYRSYGWHVQAIDGHDPAAIESATKEALASDRPSMIACRTLIGFGAPNKQGTSGCHGAPLGAEEVAATRKHLGWNYEPFVIPEDILSPWRKAGTRCHADFQAWQKRHDASANAAAFDAAIKGDINAACEQALATLKQKVAAEKPKHATRQSSGAVLEAIMPHLPELIGGSADLTPSNNTQVKGSADISASNYAGRYARFGVREHAMSAMLNGMALHKGIVPYGGTFLQFADYSRPAIRLAALMGQRVVFVMTHDSIGLGEDGPTHQPVEHLAALRAIPNLLVMRPCDGVETAECWEAALKNRNRPSLLALSRQNLPTLRSSGGTEGLSAKGAYILAGADEKRDVTLIATGSEVSVASDARALLKEQGINAVIVSAPCLELFDEQSDAYRASVLGAAPRIVIEAGIRQCWDRYLGDKGAFIGMTGFGASAPSEKLYEHFGITPQKTVEAAKKLLGK